MKLISLNLVLKLALYNSPDGYYKNQMDAIFIKIFKQYFNEPNNNFKFKLYETIRAYSTNSRINDMICKVVPEDPCLEENWKYFMTNGLLSGDRMSWKEQLHQTSQFSYQHKCLQTNNVIVVNDSEDASVEHCSGNFEFGDIDMMLSFDGDCEQPAKKPKLQSEAEIIVSRLESTALELARVKENISILEYKNRILDVCQQLKNTVS